MTNPNIASELPPQYDPAATERALYKRWLEAGVFRADADAALAGQPTYVVMMPPPNVTAVLHLGHGLNNTVQDVFTRWRRMAGDDTLWLPGTDHAGIATQNVVEKLIAREDGKTRFDVGREAFVARTESFVGETGGVIVEQLRVIGCSPDWSRLAYTLSPELSKAVREAFVRLYEKNLVYRGHRVIHWCPRCLTSLSDEEAEFHDTNGKLYHIAYRVAGESDRVLTIATTRPETMLADVAVAVNPDDDRYKDLLGKQVILPIVEREIPVIADAYADPAFGTGVVKITPAHDPNDFEVGKRHNLAMPVVITATGEMADGTPGENRVPELLRGVDRFEARKMIVKMLEASGALVKVEDHAHAVRRCYRCDTVVEPRLSDQWFVKMQPLAEPALAVVRERRVRILPERWEAVYINWLEGIRDWNISRQLWWGHRIPVWYCDACPETIVSRDDVVKCPKCGGAVRQDEDVLDTWFSSWLWPFSTLGWPNEKATDLAAFYPTDLLVTAPEILFFWVARMIMAGLEFMGEAPFHTVYLHGTARDPQHRKMSKSLGNGIDPLDVVKLYGADALRWTLISRIGLGADVILDPNDLEETFAPGRNFSTKLWNMGRFLLTNVGADRVEPISEMSADRMSRADQWILARLDQAIADCDAALGPARPDDNEVWREDQLKAGLRLNEYAEAARRFVWNELADWYLESTKTRMTTSGADRDVSRAVLVHVFDGALRLLHPIVPFITEELWQRLPGHVPGEFLAKAAWPRPTKSPGSGAQEFERVRDAVSAIRQIRSDYGIAPGKQIEAFVVAATDTTREIFSDEMVLIGALSRSAITLEAPTAGAASHALLPDGSDVIIPLAGIVDLARECEKAKTELAQLEKQLTALSGRLANAGFTAKAPPAVVEAERAKEGEWTARREQLARKVASLCG